MIMIGYNEVMAMNVDQCKIMLSYAMCLWCYASYASYVLCVCDVMQVMQVMCYVFMMLCKLCKLYATWSWCYASYASIRLCVHDASYANCYDKHWSIMTPCYASLVFDYIQVHIWHVMQVWCLIICKFIYDMLCKFGVWLYASNMCKFTPLYDMHTYAS